MQERSARTNGYASEFPQVLVVSGDLGLSQFLTEGLVESGFWMSAVRSGLQALEVFRLRTFDALIIDAALSDLPIDELLKRLRSADGLVAGAARQGADIPVVIIAGIPDELDPYDVESLNVQAVLIAPFELDELAATLKALGTAR